MSALAAEPFGPVQRVAAGVLDVGYVDIGPPGGRAVLLLHGWPYDIHSYADVAPPLAAAGYRVIVPYLRGYGPTRFRSGDAVRNGQQAVLAVDAIALLDALGVDEAIVAGFDWGARTANVMAALWPQRCRAMVSVSGYLIGSQAAGEAPLPPEAEREWWYQYYFATERGRAGYEAYHNDFARLIWRSASPAWKTLPSWAVVATADHAIHPNAERDMAKRAGSEITEIDSSHAVVATHPADVAAVIVRAVKAIG